MDPSATLALIIAATDAGDLCEAEAHAVHLREWYQGGGFRPKATAMRDATDLLADTGEPLDDYPALLWLMADVDQHQRASRVLTGWT